MRGIVFGVLRNIVTRLGLDCGGIFGWLWVIVWGIFEFVEGILGLWVEKARNN
jgi:hypothetical protein